MEKNQIRKTTSCYCLKIRRATVSVTNHYDRVLAPCGVTVRQYSMLLNIDLAKQCSITELADMVELDRSTLARNLQPLLHRGMVIDTRKVGKRNCQLELTLEGKHTLEYANQLWAKAQQDFIQKMGSDGLTAFNMVIGTLESF